MVAPLSPIPVDSAPSTIADPAPSSPPVNGAPSPIEPPSSQPVNAVPSLPQRATLFPSPVNAPWSLSPASNHRPFPRQESSGPLPLSTFLCPISVHGYLPSSRLQRSFTRPRLNRPHPHPSCLVPYLRRNLIVRSHIHAPWCPSRASNHRPIPRPHSLIPSPRRGSIAPCPVDAASSHPHWATIVPFLAHAPSFLPPSSHRRPFPRRRNSTPSSSGLPSSLPSCMLNLPLSE